MKNIIILLVLCAIFSFTLALPLGKGGLGSYLRNADADTACESLFDCAGSGDSCIGDSNPLSAPCNYTDVDNENGTCCGYGLTCKDSECMTDNLDEDCTQNSDCFGNYQGVASYYCNSDKVCAIKYYPGDSCEADSDCVNNKCDNETSVCVGNALGSSCLTTPCAYGLKCSAGVCAAQSGEDGPCSFDTDCFYGLACNGTVCVEPYSAGENSTCGYSFGADILCDTDLVCFNGECVEGEEWEQEDCDDNSDCETGEVCTCSEISGEQFCMPTDQSFQNFTNSRDAEKDLWECIRDNNCTHISNAPNSCVEQNCGSEYDDTSDLSCEVGSDTYGSCYYNDSCGGFPLWAIIVIIIVAVVLVLVVVVVVVMAMRKRRQYDTIA